MSDIVTDRDLFSEKAGNWERPMRGQRVLAQRNQIEGTDEV